MVDRSPAFRMADRLMDGRFEAVLRERRDKNQSWANIARSLFMEYGVDVTHETLRRWARELGIEDTESVA